MVQFKHETDGGPVRRHSVVSLDANSVYSQAESMHHILGTPAAGSSTLRPPRAPISFANRLSQFGTGVSLSLNYIPNKFSGSILSSGGSRFRGGKPSPLTRSSKWIDVSNNDKLQISSGSEKLRWNKFKWILFITNCFVGVILSITRCFMASFPILVDRLLSGSHYCLPSYVVRCVEPRRCRPHRQSS